MDLISGIIGFILGLMTGSGLILLYIRRKFTSSMQQFQEEMEYLEDQLMEPEEMMEEEDQEKEKED
jgi:nitrate reductase gamma subunit